MHIEADLELHRWAFLFGLHEHRLVVVERSIVSSKLDQLAAAADAELMSQPQWRTKMSQINAF